MLRDSGRRPQAGCYFLPRCSNKSSTRTDYQDLIHFLICISVNSMIDEGQIAIGLMTKLCGKAEEAHSSSVGVNRAKQLVEIVC